MTKKKVTSTGLLVVLTTLCGAFVVLGFELQVLVCRLFASFEDLSSLVMHFVGEVP